MVRGKSEIGISAGGFLAVRGAEIRPQDIRSWAFAGRTAYSFAEIPESPERDDLFVLEFAAPVRIRRFLISFAQRQLIASVREGELSEALRTWLGSRCEEQREKGSGFSFDSALCEAKIRENDYIRAATLGVNPYRRFGMVAPVIKAALDESSMRVDIEYLGTSSSMHRSAYFSANPVHSFDLKRAARRHSIVRRGSSFEAVSEFEHRDTERDPQACGIWYLSLSKLFRSLISAAAHIAEINGALGG